MWCNCFFWVDNGARLFSALDFPVERGGDEYEGLLLGRPQLSEGYANASAEALA